MASIGESLKTFWLANGIKFRGGASSEELAAFENKFSVRLPDDLRDYLAIVDGFDCSENWQTDNEVITFLPLNKFVPMGNEWSNRPEAKSFFIFADYSISAHVYAVHLSADENASNPVFISYDEPQLIAESFAGFVHGYLATDYGVLFPN